MAMCIANCIFKVQFLTQPGVPCASSVHFMMFELEMSSHICKEQSKMQSEGHSELQGHLPRPEVKSQQFKRPTTKRMHSLRDAASAETSVCTWLNWARKSGAQEAQLCSQLEHPQANREG